MKCLQNSEREEFFQQKYIWDKSLKIVKVEEKENNPTRKIFISVVNFFHIK